MTAPVALVTGASSGIGAATARTLQSLGHVVHGAARRTDRLADLETEGVHPLALDVTDEASLQAGVAAVLEHSGRIDVLVNNAGYGSYGAIEDVDPAEAQRQFDVNVFGAMRLTQLVLPHMRAQGGGTVVNISSMGGRFHTPLGGWYHATKFALEALSDALRVEVAPFGIDVVVIEPGGIATSGPTSPPTTSRRPRATAPMPTRPRPCRRRCAGAPTATPRRRSSPTRSPGPSPRSAPAPATRSASERSRSSRPAACCPIVPSTPSSPGPWACRDADPLRRA